MVDELNPSGELDPTSDDDVESGGRTEAEIEDFWKKRVSGKDKAHAAALDALKAQHASELDALRAQTAAEREAGTKVTDDINAVKAENEALKQRAEAAERAAKVTDLKHRFPSAASELGDELIATMPEEKLTSLESRLTGAAASEGNGGGNVPTPDSMQNFIMENAQPRPFAGQTPVNRPPTSAELERELERRSGEVLNW